jgi:hypothetical protein
MSLFPSDRILLEIVLYLMVECMMSQKHKVASSAEQGKVLIAEHRLGSRGFPHNFPVFPLVILHPSVPFWLLVFGVDCAADEDLGWAFQGILLLLVALPVMIFVMPSSSSAGADVIVEIGLLIGHFLREGSHELLKKSRIFLVKREINALVVVPARKGVVLLHERSFTCSWERTVSSSLKMP